MARSMREWDIFCRVVDNYGDIGVCWRLARQIANEYGFSVRLWVDDLASFARIQPHIDPALNSQMCDGVRVNRWREPFPLTESAEVVIEAFACALPENYLVKMRETQPVWINLEYLSAEDWVAGCHEMASPQLGLNKYFFFPGFAEKTGGVLGEAAMRAARAAWSEYDRAHWLNQHASVDYDALVISMFAYENNGIGALLADWALGEQPVHVLLPEGRLMPQVREALEMPELASGKSITHGHLHVSCLPMLPQEDYDRLLWSCDLNFVRGEDSFVRAQWAALPMVWHIYPQDDDAHHAKLDAFLDIYCEGMPTETAMALRNFFWAWNHGADVGAAWPAFSAALPALRQHAQGWAIRLAAQGDLAANLVKFVAAKVE